MTPIPAWGVPDDLAPPDVQFVPPSGTGPVLVLLSRLQDYAARPELPRTVVAVDDADGVVPDVPSIGIVDLLGPGDLGDLPDLLGPAARGADLAHDLPADWVDALPGPANEVSADDLPDGIDVQALRDPAVREGFDEAVEAIRAARSQDAPSFALLQRFLRGLLPAAEHARVGRAVQVSARGRHRLAVARSLNQLDDLEATAQQKAQAGLMAFLGLLAQRRMQVRHRPGARFRSDPTQNDPGDGDAPPRTPSDPENWVRALRGDKPVTLAGPEGQITLDLADTGGLRVSDVRGPLRARLDPFTVSVLSDGVSVWSGTSTEGVLLVPLATLDVDGTLGFDVTPSP